MYLVGLLLVVVMAVPASAAPGDPDPNFGGFGQTLIPLAAGSDVVARGELGFDQKLILVGHRTVSGDDDLLVVRLDPDGTIDEGFGNAGSVLTDVGDRDDSANAVALDPLGFVVVAGFVQTAGSPDLVIVRYGGAGAPDASFGTAGVVVTDVGGGDDRAYAVVTRPDRRVVVAGRSGGSLLVAQYDEVGLPDAAFGTAGVVTATPAPGSNAAWSATLQSDGKLIVAGEANGDLLVGRFLANGVPDGGFGTGGFVVRDAGGTDVAVDVQVRGDGAVFAGGSTTAGNGGDGLVLGLDAFGAPLLGFGVNGLVLSGLPGIDAFTAIDLAPSGAVVGAGSIGSGGDDDVLVVRLTSGGALDATFGLNGVVTRDFAVGDDRAVGMAVERSGRIVVGASAGNGGDDDPGALRVLGDPPAQGMEFQVNTYTTDYQLDASVAVDAGGRFVVVWSSFGGTGTDSADYGIHGQRYEADGEPSGPAFQVNSYTTGYQTAPAVAADAVGNFVVVWQSDGSPGADQSGTAIVGRRFAANGTPLGSDFQVNSHTTGGQSYPRVAASASGEFVVVWESESSAGTDSGMNSLSSVQGRFFDSAGTPLGGGDMQLNSVTAANQRSPVVAMTGGDVVVAWDTDTSPGDDVSPPAVAVRHFSSVGTPSGAELQVNEHVTGVQAYPGVAMGSDGRFLVVWHGDGPEDDALTGFGTFARRFNPDASAASGQFLVNDQTAGEQVLAAAAYDSDHSSVVLWQGAGAGDGFGVFGRRFDALGVPQGASFRVNQDTEDAQQRVVVGQGIGGDFVVVWESYALADSDRSRSAVAGARFDGQTTFSTTSTLPTGTTTSTSSTVPGTSTTTTSLPGGTSTSTTMPTATSSTTSTSTTTSSTTSLPGGTTTSTIPASTTSTSLPGGTTTSTSLPGATTTTSTSTSSTLTTLPGSTTTTTTTLPGGTTTTTVVGGGPGIPLLGKKLIIKRNPANPSKTLVKAVAKDPIVDLGAGNGSSDDPVLQGGGVRIALSGGFDGDFSIPSDRWKYLKKPGKGRGYKAKAATPIKVVVVKPGKLLKVVGKGSALAVDLATEPTSVEIVVRIGGRRYCMRFVGTHAFVAGRKLVSKSAERPVACLP